MDTAEKVDRVFSEIISHHRADPRSFPWRDTDDPYRILVSEYMLQQTQTDRVVPKYLSFTEKFPTVRDLARATGREVLALWIGLGYNRRATALHRAAQIIVERHGGEVPDTEEGLRGLPGVGAYTAAAVMAFAHNREVVLIETNIRTVVLHHFFRDKRGVDDSAVLRYVARLLAAAVREGISPRTFYSACMDYGAHLKRSGIRTNTRSKGYVPQTAFPGSVRQARGSILRLCVRCRGGVPPERISALGMSRSDEALANLVADGTLCRRRGRYYVA